MKSLLIVAHGSRKNTSNEEVKSLGDTISLSLQTDFSCVKVAFLEFASPSIEMALNALFDNGTSELIVLPYFLSAGKHVTTDLPEAVNTSMTMWPDRALQILPHIGAMDLMVNLIVSASTTKSR